MKSIFLITEQWVFRIRFRFWTTANWFNMYILWYLHDSTQ